MTEKQIFKKRQEILQKIKEKMEQLGFSQDQIADKAGFKQSSVSRMLSGNFPPTLDNLIKLAAAVELEVDVN